MGRLPDSKDHGANMGLIWGWQDPSGPHVGPMNFAIWVTIVAIIGTTILLYFQVNSLQLTWGTINEI